MSLRAARTLAATFLVLMLLALTWPGLIPFDRVEPYVLGLPFVMAWITGWVVLSIPVLWLLDRVEARARERRGEG